MFREILWVDVAVTILAGNRWRTQKILTEENLMEGYLQ